MRITLGTKPSVMLGFFTLRGLDIMNLKKPYSLDEQIAKLKEHGVIIDDVDFAKSILQQVSYYRLSGYMIQYRIQPYCSRLKYGVKFKEIYSLYRFDEELRALLRLYIERAEFFYKNLIGNVFAELKCSSPPHNQHYDVGNYYDKKGIEKTLQNFANEKRYYRDSAIIKHHENKYGDKMPLWVMMELMTCSSISMFYHALYISDKEKISSEVGISPTTLENHLHALSVLRNKCSHGVRLYNSIFNPPVKFNKNFLRRHPEIRNNTLFAYILMLIKRLPTDEDRKQFRDRLNRVINKYNHVISFNLIGFPADYRKELYIKNLRSII